MSDVPHLNGDTPQFLAWLDTCQVSRTVSPMTQFRHTINATEAARILGRDPRQATRYAQDGKVDALKMPGRTGAWIFNEASVRAFAASLRAEASASAHTPAA